MNFGRDSKYFSVRAIRMHGIPYVLRGASTCWTLAHDIEYYVYLTVSKVSVRPVLQSTSLSRFPHTNEHRVALT